jgi:hypothetical protein
LSRNNTWRSYSTKMPWNASGNSHSYQPSSKLRYRCLLRSIATDELQVSLRSLSHSSRHRSRFFMICRH